MPWSPLPKLERLPLPRETRASELDRHSTGSPPPPSPASEAAEEGLPPWLVGRTLAKMPKVSEVDRARMGEGVVVGRSEGGPPKLKERSVSHGSQEQRNDFLDSAISDSS